MKVCVLCIYSCRCVCVRERERERERERGPSPLIFVATKNQTKTHKHRHVQTLSLSHSHMCTHAHIHTLTHHCLTTPSFPPVSKTVVWTPACPIDPSPATLMAETPRSCARKRQFGTGQVSPTLPLSTISATA